MISSFLKKVGAAASAAVAATGLPSNVAQPPIVIGGRTLRIRDQLGEGGYAFVYSVEDVNTGDTLALKRMIAGDREQKAIAEKEIAIMKQLRGHDHVIDFLGACTKESQNGSRATEYYLLMELCDGGSLIKDIQNKQATGARYSEREICNIFHQLCLALECMHSQNPPICHRDLKIENVLIKGNGRQRIYKLCDFGSCTTRAQCYNTKDEILAEEERIQKFSTSMYRAPEMVDLYKRELVNEKVDIWAAGCILFTLAYFTQPFQEGGTLQILSGNYEIPEDNPYSKYLTALIKRLLTVQPAKRPDIKLVIKMVEHWGQWLKSGVKEMPVSVSPAGSASSTSSSSGGESRPRKKSLNRECSESDSVEKRSKEKNEEKEAKKKKKNKSKDLAAQQKSKLTAATPPVHSVSNDNFAADWNPFAAAHSNPGLTTSPSLNGTPMSAPSAHSAPNATQAYAPPPSGPVGNDSAQPTKVAMLFDLGDIHNPPPPAPHGRAVSASASASAASHAHHSHASFSASASTPPPTVAVGQHSVDASSAFQSDEWAKFSPPAQRIVQHTELEPGEEDWAAFDSTSFDAIKAIPLASASLSSSVSSSSSIPVELASGERSPAPLPSSDSDALAAAPGIFFAHTPAVPTLPASKKKLKKGSSAGERAASP